MHKHKHINHQRTSGPIGFIPMCAFIILLAAALMSSAPARAASVSFFLDQSNALPDDINYLSVTLTEIGDGVNVVVQTLDPLNNIAGDNFGIQKFGFGLSNGVSEEITGLSDGWNVKYNKHMDGFGSFDFRLQGKGQARVDELEFTIGGVGLDDFTLLFAAHVAGFEWCATDEINKQRNRCSGTDCATSAYFGGGEPAVVPVPPAVWLFGSGLMGLIGIARRKHKA